MARRVKRQQDEESKVTVGWVEISHTASDNTTVDEDVNTVLTIKVKSSPGQLSFDDGARSRSGRISHDPSDLVSHIRSVSMKPR